MPLATDKVKAIFLAALDKVTPAERTAFLHEACAGDTALRQRVEALLQAHDQVDRLLDRPAAEHLSIPSSGAHGAESEQPGVVVAGRYKLLEQIGEGGMGTVWVAEQSQPVRRKVALKLIKAGMDSRSVLARFEAERQALALMDHPNIAKVHDAGTTESGRPFFVMEYVKGVPITQYCDDRRLTIRDRLALFVPVSQAVQHAHQKGIIHRDLKPSNILVCLYDGVPVPKVIDFGLAKATHQPLTEHTLQTAHGVMVGTPLYMSPEQAEFNNLDVDTRTDIYALGVILYELLTGTTPVDRKRLKETPLLELLRVVREEDTIRPSSRLSTAEELPSIATKRGLEPKKLSGLVRGELDWIVMKALEKDRNRRYETANGFALDVQRYLSGEPVLAAPPSASYRLQKFARKHRAALATAVTIVLLLVAGVAVSSWQAVRATQAQQAEADRAEGERLAKEDMERERDAKEQARLKEEKERKYAQAIADFVRNDFLALTSVEGQSRFGGGTEVSLDKDATLRQLLDRAAEKLNRRADLDPRIEAELRWMIGVNYRGLGEAELAIPFLQRCVALRKELFGPDHHETLSAQNSLAMSYTAAGKLDLALPLLKETLELWKAKVGADHPDTLTSMNNLAGSYQATGRRDLALPLSEETLKLTKARLGADHPHTLASMSNLATGYLGAGKLDLAVPLLEKTLQLRRSKLGADHPDTFASMDNLARGYLVAGKLDLALPLHEEALQLRRAKLGADHPDTLMSMNTLAEGYQEAGKLDLALPLYEETLKLRRSKLGADHPQTLTSMNNLATGYLAIGKLDLALPLYEETLQLAKVKLGADHHNTLMCMNNLARGYLAARKLDLALPLLEKTLQLAKTKLGADHPNTLATMNNLAAGYQLAGKLGLALPLLEETFNLSKAKLGADHPDTFTSMNNLAKGYLAAGKLDLALPLIDETFNLSKAKLGADHPTTLTSLGNLASGYQAARKLDLALPLHEETLKLRKVKLGADHPDTLTSMNNLATGYLAAKKLDLALPLLEETFKLRKARLGAEHPDTLVTMSNLAEGYLAARKLDLALPLFDETLKLMKANLGANDPRTLSTMNNLARGYQAAGKLDLALPLFDETLQLRKAKLGADHPHTLQSMNNLAAGYQLAGKLGLALPLLEETFNLSKAKLGADHPHTLQSMNNLAVGYLAAGKLDLALPLLQEAAAAIEKWRFQPESSSGTVNNLIYCHEQLKQFDQAEVWRRKWLAVVKERSGADSLLHAAELSGLGSNLGQQKKWTDVEAVLRECLAICETKQPQAWTTFNIQSRLGGALFSQNKYADAEPMLLKGYEGMKQRAAQIPPQGKMRLTEGVERLIALYEATGNKDEATRWRKELEKAKTP